MPEKINILFLAAEAEPFVKIGGLADVAGSLPPALRRLSSLDSREITLDVRLMLPRHRVIQGMTSDLQPVAEFSLTRDGKGIPVQVFETKKKGMPVYFIDGEPISSAPTVYSSNQAQDREKYAFFSLAAMEFVHHSEWKPDIIHVNDWHTSLASFALRSRQNETCSPRVRTVLTVHNLPYMGGYDSEVLSSYGLSSIEDDTLPGWAKDQFLPLGLWSADSIVPVSPTYAREILSPEFGCGLESFLKTRLSSLTGILNGLDIDAWNPETDKSLAARFSSDHLDIRTTNKIALQHDLDLKEDVTIPLLVMIGRIDHQKGIDITFETLKRIADKEWQFILLGSGDTTLENAARQMQEEFPERIRAVIRYDEALGRLMYGGADIFLMPSRYEPCGLAQMIAMRYGCVPVVHATGGLRDTVRDGKTGFIFQEATATSMEEGIFRALSSHASPEIWKKLQSRGMHEDFSWQQSARKYARIYRSLRFDP
jgi:starch synthase